MLKRLKRLRRDEGGATALEFALVVTPFLFTLFAVFEFALVYLCSVTLDNATSGAARQIRTGEAASAGLTQTSFGNAVCARMGWLTSSCPGQLYVDVRTLTTFQNPAKVDPVVNGTFQKGNLMYDGGTACSIVIVRTFYQWPLLTYALKAGLGKVSGNIDVLTATTAFRNEPFNTTATC